MSTTIMPATRQQNVARCLLKALCKLALAAILLAGGVYLWALSATDTSLIARGIMWGDADVGDLNRFPNRAINASSEPRMFTPSTPEWLDELKVNDMPFETYLERSATTAFIILHGDKLLYEGYFNGSNREAMQPSLSVAKSFVSTLVGIALAEGHIDSLEDPITDYIPELVDRDGRFQKITIRHLLTMSSGLRFVADDADPFSDDFLTYYSPNLRETGLGSRIKEEPGWRFRYNDFNPLLIGMMLERATGMSVSNYLESRLWQPMGAEGDGSWDLDSEASGFEKMTVGVNGRAIDLAKLGWLYLNDGKNGDRQVVSAAWVEEATRLDTATDPAAHYQYFWWIDEEHNAYYAEGNFCQYIYVYPDADLVLTRTGTQCSNSYSAGFLGDVAQWIEERLDK